MYGIDSLWDRAQQFGIDRTVYELVSVFDSLRLCPRFISVYAIEHGDKLKFKIEFLWTLYSSFIYV